MLAVRSGHVLRVGDKTTVHVGAHMAGHALPPVKDLHHRLAQSHLHLPASELIGHGVEGALHLDVVVDVDAGPLPEGELIGTSGKR